MYRWLRYCHLPLISIRDPNKWLNLGDLKPLERKQGNQKPMLPDVENSLNDLIRGKRGSLCTVGWVEAQAKRLTSPYGVSLSRGWLYRFFARNRWSLRKVTNKNKLPEEEITKRLLDFHCKLAKLLNEKNIPNESIMNMDESPICLFADSLRTIAETGTDSVNVGRGQGFKERRYATLVVSIKAGGPQPEKIHVILRGKGTRIKEAEESSWPANVVVHFQDNAWMDTETMTDWVNAQEFTRNTVLLMDNLNAHRAVEEMLADLGVITWFGPAKTTDYWQPVDRTVGKWIKDRVHQIIEKYQVDHQVELDKLAAWQVRKIFLEVMCFYVVCRR